MENLVDRVARYLVDSKHAIALTGAGISTESGIPDFRGPSGVWTKNPEAERKAYRSYERFIEDPKGWWKERLTSPNLLGDVEKVPPNTGHYALAELERLGILKCVITQNVDGLHEKAGTKKLLEYHGSILKLRCVTCTSRFRKDEFELEKLMREDRLPPRCPRCGGIVKTDGVAFGEPIPGDVAQHSLNEASRCDLMLICGTSAVVYPFANLPRVAKYRKTETRLTVIERNLEVKIIEVNAEPTPLTEEGISDCLIQGKTGEVLPKIVEEVKRLQGV